MPPDDLANRFPHLFEEVIWSWGPTRARFILLDSTPSNHLIANVSIIPRYGEEWIMLRLRDGSWEIPGSTLGPKEKYIDTVPRGLGEEAGARRGTNQISTAPHVVTA